MFTFYMPPPSLRTRILDHSGKYALSKGSQRYTDQTGNYTDIAFVSSDKDGDDQYWSIEHPENGTTCGVIRNKANSLIINVGWCPPAWFMMVEGSLNRASACR